MTTDKMNRRVRNVTISFLLALAATMMNGCAGGMPGAGLAGIGQAAMGPLGGALARAAGGGGPGLGALTGTNPGNLAGAVTAAGAPAAAAAGAPAAATAATAGARSVGNGLLFDPTTRGFSDAATGTPISGLAAGQQVARERAAAGKDDSALFAEPAAPAAAAPAAAPDIPL